MWLAGVVVFVVLGVGSGVWMARRMARYWPQARELTGEQREAVVAAVRCGERLEDTDLQHAAVGYRDGLYAVADHNRPVRWLVVLVLVIAVATAAWDAVYGSWGNAVVSVVYLVLIGFELFWVVPWQRRLLDNADRATEPVADPAPDES